MMLSVIFKQSNTSDSWVLSLSHLPWIFDTWPSKWSFWRAASKFSHQYVRNSYFLHYWSLRRCCETECGIFSVHHWRTTQLDCHQRLLSCSARRVRKLGPITFFHGECESRTSNHSAKISFVSTFNKWHENHSCYRFALRWKLHGRWIRKLYQSSMLQTRWWSSKQSCRQSWFLGRL